jgi:hypothetical protein
MANSQITLNGTDLGGNQFTVVLTLANNKWVKTEPGGVNQIFLAANGVWMRAVNIVTLFQADAVTRVGQFTPLVPETANAGDVGNGNEFETASTLTWTVGAVVP